MCIFVFVNAPPGYIHDDASYSVKCTFILMRKTLQGEILRAHRLFNKTVWFLHSVRFKIQFHIWNLKYHAMFLRHDSLGLNFLHGNHNHIKKWIHFILLNNDLFLFILFSQRMLHRNITDFPICIILYLINVYHWNSCFVKLKLV